MRVKIVGSNQLGISFVITVIKITLAMIFTFAIHLLISMPVFPLKSPFLSLSTAPIIFPLSIHVTFSINDSIVIYRRLD